MASRQQGKGLLGTLATLLGGRYSTIPVHGPGGWAWGAETPQRGALQAGATAVASGVCKCALRAP